MEPATNKLFLVIFSYFFYLYPSILLTCHSYTYFQRTILILSKKAFFSGIDRIQSGENSSLSILAQRNDWGYTRREIPFRTEFIAGYLPALLARHFFMEPAMITLIESDITTLDVDAIVNAANSSLLGGGGVDGAIHAAAGPELLAVCREIGGCAAGQAVLTPGFNLPARHIIHTVGPQWRGGGNNEHTLLANCYRSCMEIAAGNMFSSIAFAAISCGAYGFPIEEAAEIAISTLQDFLNQYDRPDKVLIVCFNPQTRSAFTRALQQINQHG